MEKSFFPANFRALREAAGLKQKDVARAVFVTPQTVSKWEQGTALPSVENLLALCRLLHTSLDALFAPPEAAGPKVFAAVDGGGTKTECVAFEETGRVLARGVVGASNPNAVGAEESAARVLQGVRHVAGDRALTGLFAGVAGCGLQQHAQRLQKALARGLGMKNVFVDTDVRCVQHSVRGLAECTLVIAGTGSSVFAAKGETLRRFGGFGYLFDRAGSGFDLGREAIARTLERENGLREDSAALAAAVEETFGGPLLPGLDRLYREDRAAVAAFARPVLALARAGDPDALAVARENAGRLLFLVERARQLEPCGDAVVFAGGLARQPVFQELLTRGLPPGVKGVFPQAPPVYGAARYVLQLTGTPVDEDAFEQEFTRTYAAQAASAREGGAI